MSAHHQRGSSKSVVKSVHIRGITDDHYGELSVEIDTRDADLSQGRWLACIDSLIVTATRETGLAGDIPVSVSATHSHASVCQGRGRRGLPAPARQVLFVLQDIAGPRQISVTGNWLEIVKPANSFNLVFENAETDAAVKRLQVQALLLLTRVVEQHY
jgi:hypothetical protein